MRKLFPFLLTLTFGMIVYAIPLTFYISNLESSLYIQARPLSLGIGYPFSSITVGNSPYLEVRVDESTPVYYLNGGWKVWKNESAFLSVGAKIKAGEIPNALSNEKIREVGRNYLFSELSSSFDNLRTQMSYVRYFSSVDKNVSKGIFFLAPPNYISEVANTMSFALSYSSKFNKTFEFTLIFKGTFRFSDAFVFSSPTFEFGFSFSTTLEELQKNFR